MYELLSQSRGNVIGVRVTDKVVAYDYHRFRPVIDERVRAYGKVRVLIHMDRFHGFGDLGSVWEDVKLDAAHYTDVERLAFVGEKRWQDWMARATDLLAPVDVRYFDELRLDDAWAWVLEGSAGD